jgi:4-amino-4-deoxy-L-arabinose transferase-like glycosyltransferase
MDTRKFEFLDHKNSLSTTIQTSILFILSVMTLWIGVVLKNNGIDDPCYLEMAQNILAGKGYMVHSPNFGPSFSFMPPLPAYVIAAFLSKFTNYVFALHLFFVLFSGATKVVFFYIARKIFTPTWAFIATLAWILYPPGWFWGSRISSHTIAMNLLVVAFWLALLAYERKSSVLSFVIGFLCGLMGLCRGEYVFSAMMFAGLGALFFKGSSFRWKFGAVVLVGWVMAMSPWWIRNYRVHGHPAFTCTYASLVVWMSLHPDYQFTGDAIELPVELQQKLDAEPNEVKKSKIVMNDLKVRLKQHPEIIVRTVGGNLINFWRPWLSPKVAPFKENVLYVISYLPVFILFVYGLFVVKIREMPWNLLLGLMLFRMVSYLPAYTIVRFRETLIPFFLLVAVAALAKNAIIFKKEPGQ